MMFLQSLIEESDLDKAYVLSQLVPSSKSLAALQEALQRNLLDKVSYCKYMSKCVYVC